MLFSATQTRNVEDLARISLKKAPLYVGVDDHKETSTVEGLEQVCSGHPSSLQHIGFMYVHVIVDRHRTSLDMGCMVGEYGGHWYGTNWFSTGKGMCTAVSR